MKKPDHPPVVYVEWIDAALVSARWEEREQVLKDAARLADPICAAGFLLADEERGVVVCIAYNDHNDDAGHAMFIPRAQLTKLVHVRPGRGFKVESA